MVYRVSSTTQGLQREALSQKTNKRKKETNKQAGNEVNVISGMAAVEGKIGSSSSRNEGWYHRLNERGMY